MGVKPWEARQLCLFHAWEANAPGRRSRPKGTGATGGSGAIRGMGKMRFATRVKTYRHGLKCVFDRLLLPCPRIISGASYLFMSICYYFDMTCVMGDEGLEPPTSCV